MYLALIPTTAAASGTLNVNFSIWDNHSFRPIEGLSLELLALSSRIW